MSEDNESNESFQRKFKTEWKGNVIHEYTELLRDNALHLIQEAQEHEKDEISSSIINYLREFRAKLDTVLEKRTLDFVKFVDLEPDEIVELELWKIDQTVLLDITNLCQDINRKIVTKLSQSNYFKEMVDIATVQVYILSCIQEMSANARRLMNSSI